MKSLERIPLTSSSVGHARDPKRVGKSALDGKASPAPGTNSVLDFLNSAKITFSIVDHSPAFSSQAVRRYKSLSLLAVLPRIRVTADSADLLRICSC